MKMFVWKSDLRMDEVRTPEVQASIHYSYMFTLEEWLDDNAGTAPPIR